MVEAERAAAGEGPRRRHRRGARPVLQGRHRARDGGLSQTTSGALRARRLRGILREGRRAGDDDLSRVRRLQALVRQPGSGAARGAQYPGAVRSQVDEAQQRRLPPHRRRGAEARVRGSRHLLRRPGVRRDAGRRPAVEGVREGARPADRLADRRRGRISPGTRCRFDSKVKEWKYWVANICGCVRTAPARRRDPNRLEARSRTRPTSR